MSECEADFGYEFRKRKRSREPGRKTWGLEFADDILLLKNNIPLVNDQLNSLQREALKVGLDVNVEKTECMALIIDTNEAICLNGKLLRKVKNFKYLGSSISDFESRRD